MMNPHGLFHEKSPSLNCYFQFDPAQHNEKSAPGRRMTLSSEKQHLTCKAYGPMVPQNDEFELFPWQNKIGTIPQIIPNPLVRSQWGHDQIHPDIYNQTTLGVIQIYVFSINTSI